MLDVRDHLLLNKVFSETICIEVVLEFLKGHDVPTLKLSILLELALNRVVGQVNLGFTYGTLIETELPGACPYVAFPEHVHLLLLGDQNPDPNVELTLVDQKWPLEVLLHDEAARFHLLPLLRCLRFARLVWCQLLILLHQVV